MDKRNREFDRIFQKYYSELCIFAYRYVTSKDVAEDIVQELFCHFLESGTVFRHEDGESSLRSYLYTCTRSRAIDYLRHAGNRHARLEDHGHSIELELYVENMLINREEGYDYRVLLSEINTAISALPVKTKRVFLMSRAENMSNKEIAISLGVSIKAIEKHITKAISLIRVHLQKSLSIG
jgi:RNA polymerase sigma-70 factor (ECF subfamily)